MLLMKVFRASSFSDFFKAKLIYNELYKCRYLSPPKFFCETGIFALEISSRLFEQDDTNKGIIISKIFK
jgi:hypothetical protein